ncbi:MAG: LysR family glycine cleavage system transcriptional activator [Alteromonadaceae bacterium]|jgi:LysR family glycine cleavage system transcriptional activator
MSKLPSLKSMQTFEATARHLSFTRAADELCVSQSAVSHQIKSLEIFLGKKLLTRSNNLVSLTSDGDIYFSVVKDCFKRMQTITDHLMLHNRPKLRIMAQTSIAVDWLAPRISFFTKQHPDVEVNLSMAAQADEFDPTEYDILVGTWPVPKNFITQKIRDERWFPVCSKQLYEQLDPDDPYSILKFPLYSSEKGQDWELWMQHQKIDTPINPDIQYVSHTLLAAKAALSGMGIALSCNFIVSDAIQQGQLMSVGSLGYNLPWGHYSIHYHAGNHYLDKIETFIDWLMMISNDNKT